MRRKLEKRKGSISGTKLNFAIISFSTASVNMLIDANTFTKVSEHIKTEMRREAAVRIHTALKAHLKKGQLNLQLNKNYMNLSTKLGTKCWKIKILRFLKCIFLFDQIE